MSRRFGSFVQSFVRTSIPKTTTVLMKRFCFYFWPPPALYYKTFPNKVCHKIARRMDDFDPYTNILATFVTSNGPGGGANMELTCCRFIDVQTVMAADIGKVKRPPPRTTLNATSRKLTFLRAPARFTTRPFPLHLTTRFPFVTPIWITCPKFCDHFQSPNDYGGNEMFRFWTLFKGPCPLYYKAFPILSYHEISKRHADLGHLSKVLWLPQSRNYDGIRENFHFSGSWFLLLKAPDRFTTRPFPFYLAMKIIEIPLRPDNLGHLSKVFSDYLSPESTMVILKWWPKA